MPDAQPNDRKRVLDILWGFAECRVLIAAVELDIFTAIAKGHNTAKAVAAQSEVSERGVRILLNALTSMEFLSKKRSAYFLEPIAGQFLVKGRKGYMGANVLHAIHLWERWASLTEAVKTGTAADLASARERGARFFPILVEALFPINYPIACEGYDQLGVGKTWKNIKVLDVAGGSAPWSVPVAERDPKSRVTLLDFPEPVKVARRFVKKHKVEKQFQFIESNLWDVDWGTNQYDLIVLGHICHSEGEKKTREMIRRAFRALKPDGKLLIAEMVADDRCAGPGSWPLMFAVNMLVNTEEGDTFTFSEYRRWCKAAGFRSFEALPVKEHSPLLVATKLIEITAEI